MQRSTLRTLVAAIEDWFLTKAQTGNRASAMVAWCEGNAAEPLVPGAANGNVIQVI